MSWVAECGATLGLEKARVPFLNVVFPLEVLFVVVVVVGGWGWTSFRFRNHRGGRSEG